MKKVINVKVRDESTGMTIDVPRLYDTEKGEVLVERVWNTPHPHADDVSLRHERRMLRTGKGALFAYSLDESGITVDPAPIVSEDLFAFANHDLAVGWAQEAGLDITVLLEGLEVEEA